MLLALLLCTLLLRDIDGGADILEDLARVVQNRMRQGVEDSQSGIEVREPVLGFPVSTIAHSLREAFHDSGTVIRKNVLRYLLERGQAFRRVAAEDAITLVRPMQNGI